MQAALDLIGLLIVLVRPHVVGESAGKGVEGKPFQPVAEGRIARMASDCSSENMVLDHGTELRALRRIAPGKMLIAGEHAVGQTVIAVERRRSS